MVHFIPAGAKVLVEESNQQGKAVYEFATREEIIDTLLTRSKSVAVANSALRRIEARRKASVACTRSRIPAVLSNDATITKQARESRQAFQKWRRKNDSRCRERMQRHRREKDEAVVQVRRFLGVLFLLSSELNRSICLTAGPVQGCRAREVGRVRVSIRWTSDVICSVSSLN